MRGLTQFLLLLLGTGLVLLLILGFWPLGNREYFCAGKTVEAIYFWGRHYAGGRRDIAVRLELYASTRS